MDRALHLASATGNRFALFDGFDGLVLRDAGAVAAELGRRAELGLDGLLQLLPPREDGHVRMVVHNVDGSRAAACGNGLRCVALLARRAGYVDAQPIRIETDAGLREVEVTTAKRGRARGRASMGPVHVDGAFEVPAPVARLLGPDAACSATIVDAGNPHCVLFVPDVDVAPLHEVGPLLERDHRFPDRTNVELVEVRDETIRVRVWERGVGETRSCGTGATSAAFVAVTLDHAVFPLRVEMPGGVLVVDRERGELFLEGEVELEERRRLTLSSDSFATPADSLPPALRPHERDLRQ